MIGQCDSQSSEVKSQIHLTCLSIHNLHFLYQLLYCMSNKVIQVSMTIQSKSNRIFDKCVSFTALVLPRTFFCRYIAYLIDKVFLYINNLYKNARHIEILHFCSHILRDTEQAFESNEIKKVGKNSSKKYSFGYNIVTSWHRHNNLPTKVITICQSINDKNNFFSHISKKPPRTPVFLTLMYFSQSQSMPKLGTAHEEIELLLLFVVLNRFQGWHTV